MKDDTPMEFTENNSIVICKNANIHTIIYSNIKNGIDLPI